MYGPDAPLGLPASPSPPQHRKSPRASLGLPLGEIGEFNMVSSRLLRLRQSPDMATADYDKLFSGPDHVAGADYGNRRTREPRGSAIRGDMNDVVRKRVAAGNACHLTSDPPYLPEGARIC